MHERDFSRYERDFSQKGKRYEMIDAFNSTSWTIYSISIIFTLNCWFTEHIPMNFNLTKSNASDTEAAILDLPIENNTVHLRNMKSQQFEIHFHEILPKLLSYQLSIR